LSMPLHFSSPPEWSSLYPECSTRDAFLLWAARRLVMQKAEAAVGEVLETVIVAALPEGNIDIQARFNEYSLDLEVTYTGQLCL
jgi:hypothetical protein